MAARKIPFNVMGKVIVITGGSGTLGGAMAKHLIQQGAHVAILGYRDERVVQKLKELATFGTPMGMAVDVTDESQMTTVRHKVLKKWGRIDVLINAAGGNLPGATIPPEKTVFDVSLPDLRSVIDLNLMGSVVPSIVIGKVMADQKQGSIINISSMAAERTLTRVFGYSMAKAGINMLTKWMSTELAQKYGDGIRVNAVAPGFFIGDQNRTLLTQEDGSYTDRGGKIISNTPMHRFGEIHELNGIVQFLASDESSFVTGTIIPVDGGFSSYSGV